MFSQKETPFEFDGCLYEPYSQKLRKLTFIVFGPECYRTCLSLMKIHPPWPPQSRQRTTIVVNVSPS